MSEQRHRYEYQVRPDSAPEKVIRMVGKGRRVLELGPGPGSITRHLNDNDCQVTALEYDTEAIALATQFCERILSCDLNDASWPALLGSEEKFSVIVAADVLEHLYDPWTTLKKTLPLLTSDGCIVISLPHISHNAVIACLLNENFSYRPWGLLDSTHIRFWGLKNMQSLFSEAGYKIVEAEFVVYAPEQTEFADAWRMLPAATRKTLARNPFGNIYQVVIRAVPADAAGKGLQLETLTVPEPASTPLLKTSGLRRLLRTLASHLAPCTQARILRVLRHLRLWH